MFVSEHLYIRIRLFYYFLPAASHRKCDRIKENCRTDVGVQYIHIRSNVCDNDANILLNANELYFFVSPFEKAIADPGVLH